jgi:membrane protease YdiL (CAAX protease family)
VLAAVAVSAIVVAPLFEEFIFRLLIQGWLEKILMRADGDDRPIDALPLVASADSPAIIFQPPHGVSTRTRWLPIVISSLMFSMSHLGPEYGYSAIPLFFLAMILGYIYQRTHRIVPCIVAHMAFNSISITLTWIQIPPAG